MKCEDWKSQLETIFKNKGTQMGKKGSSFASRVKAKEDAAK